MAAEYVWRVPDFVVTPLRETLQAEPWFKNPEAMGVLLRCQKESEVIKNRCLDIARR
jgi:hypothetical protein